jgi:hypothetical protein
MTPIDEERPAPDEAEGQEEEGPAPEALDEDPAYNPDDETLKDIKGG